MKAPRLLVVRCCVLLAWLGLLLARPARAQQGAGTITGIVSDAATHKPAVGIIVTATSRSLQGEQITATDEAGFYRIANLPPGSYRVRFDGDGYVSGLREEISLGTDVTLRLNALMVSDQSKQVEEVVLTVNPNVDVGSSSVGTRIGSDFIKLVPLVAPGGKGGANRSFEAVAASAPGATSDQYGTGIAGTSSPENHYAIDGLSVGSPGYGTLGTQLSSEFVHEVNVVSSGYMPEYGRTTGGVINVTTKSGSNEFHGAAWSSVSPGGLEGQRATITTVGQTVQYAPSLSYIGDVGLDLGGPLIKDRLWFYGGFDLATTVFNLDRSYHRTVAGVVDPDAIASQRFEAASRTYQGMAKLTWALNDDNRVTLAVYGSPTRSGGGAHYDRNTNTLTPGGYSIDPLTGAPRFAIGTYGATAAQDLSTPLDASVKWTGEFLQKRLTLDTMLGVHHQLDAIRAADGTAAGSTSGLASLSQVEWRRSMPGPHSITDFEQFAGMERCSEAGASCPVTDYLTGGPGEFNDALYTRYHGTFIASLLLSALGHHVLKAGIDAELTSFRNTKQNRVLQESSDGTVFQDLWRFGALPGPDMPVYYDPLVKETRAMTVGGFLQDSWSVLDKVTVNLGMRYDAQYFFNDSGAVAISLPNQWAPRLGVIYDPTQVGHAKLFVNYARYFENAPLALADVALVGEPHVLAGHSAAGCDPRVPSMQVKECNDPKNLVPHDDPAPVGPNKNYAVEGAVPDTIDPSIRASSTDEISGGGEVELSADARLGVVYTRRWVNRWIEDMSENVGLPAFVANPGYGLGASFPKLERNYDAGTLFLTKTFAHDWQATLSYTLAYLRGNYAGLFRAETNEFSPNFTSDYDFKYLETNRSGPLPGDTRHSLKALGSRSWALGPHSRLDTGVALYAHSGGPTSYLGTDPAHGQNETYILPRGTGPRLPWNYDADVQLGYGISVSKGMTLSLTLAIYNVVNWQGATAVDQTWTNDNVYAIKNGTKADLDGLKTTDTHAAAVKNENFGNPTAYQSPRSFRFGLRGEF